jgi:lipopolysaccharide transport system ATP-binding protein
MPPAAGTVSGLRNVWARSLGVRFFIDRHGRPIGRSLARITPGGTRLWAIRDVSFEIGPGEGVALIGPNGAGKTTLLRALAGVYEADEGSVRIQGRPGNFLSLTGGLSAVLTGRENAYFLQLLAGLPSNSAREGISAVKARAGLGDAFDYRVESYSSGMRARLGFAALERTQPDVLFVDEVLGTLDHRFRRLAEDYLRGVLADGGIVVAAGHDHHKLAPLCSRAVLLESGALKADGPFDDVLDGYLNAKS